jgi:hypothetical protein
MHNTNDATNSGKPSRLKKILFAIVFMAVGAGITGLASTYYWNAKCSEAYGNGKIDQASLDSAKMQAQVDQDNHRLAEKFLTSTSN